MIDAPGSTKKDGEKKNQTGNVFSKMIGNSEQRSFAQFTLKEKNQNPKCGFSEDGNSLIIVTLTGLYIEAEITAKGGNL